jgi:N-acetylmuramic acid 6-phosphate etherase
MLKKMPPDILSLFGIKPSAQSFDYVNNKKQFQLHSLQTEQRHPKTWNLSFAIQEDIAEGLKQIFSVDEDITEKFTHMALDTTPLDLAAEAIISAIGENKKIYVYGCGATGRLAKQLESAIWRPFWRKIKKSRLWKKLKTSLPEDIEDRLIGEMTGGDRALISSLEGFEDLQHIGKLQLVDRGVERGDAVFCITEGGETSSVLGTLLAALDLYGPLTQKSKKETKKHLFFVYNNPDEFLKPFDRSRSVIENPFITRINLTTGPQAITGSTRMQATTSETFVMGTVLEIGIKGILQDLLSKKELASLGFTEEFNFKNRLLGFKALQRLIMGSLKDISRLTGLESETYKNNGLATYFAKQALIPVFIDCAERSPTFHLYPLDTVHEKERKCWLQVWTEAGDSRQAWNVFLGRGFRGLDEKFYKPPFETRIEDSYLKNAALTSLTSAGKDQELFYDFSFSAKNISTKGPKEGDLGVLVCVDEELDELSVPNSAWSRFLHLFNKKGGKVAVISAGDKTPQEITSIVERILLEPEKDTFLHFYLERGGDPLNLRRQTLLKIILNGHSTAVMARLGKVVGNTMTGVKPSNLKLIGRATFLIQSHVNDTINQEEWVIKYGRAEPLTYAQANALLFEAMDFVTQIGGQTGEVELSIMRILEALKTGRSIDWIEALSLAETKGLAKYLEEHNPALRR